MRPGIEKVRKRTGWTIHILGLAAVLAVFTAGCTPTGTRPDTTLTFEPCPCKKRQQSAALLSVSVSELRTDPDRYKDRLIYLQGRFMGWQGNCQGKPPETRRDWMLEHQNACIYVSGPLPPGIHGIRNSGSIGKAVWVRGHIRIDEKGNPYMKSSRE